MKNIKIKLLFFLLIFLIISSIAITVAYFYQNYTLPSQFKTMTYDVDIDEEFNNDWGVKKVFITNKDTSNTSVVLRVKYIEIWSKIIDNEKFVLSNTVNGVNVVDKTWTNTFLNDFTDGLDGWYYYNLVLKPNDRIQLLESISLNSNISSLHPEYLDYDYQLLFSYEALELDTDMISEIWNKNVDINNFDVNWS